MNNQGRRNCGSKSQKNKESFDMIVREVNAEFSRITKRSINDLERLAEQSTDNTMKKVTMTENEAVYCLKADSESHSEVCEECDLYGAVGCDHCQNDAIKIAIKALEEVQQYRAIGTPEELQEMKKDFAEALSDWRQYRKIGTLEECRAAVEKQTAKKVKSISQIKDGDSYVGLIGRCPCCGDILEEDTVYCDCGQRLDWGDEE